MWRCICPVDSSPDLLTDIGSNLVHNRSSRTGHSKLANQMGIKALRSLTTTVIQKPQSKQTVKPGENAPNRASLAVKLNQMTQVDNEKLRRFLSLGQ